MTSPGGVTWAAIESTGGTIDARGNYHPPQTPGSYHAVATSTAYPTKSATAAVNEVPAADATTTVASVLTQGKTGVQASVPSGARG